MSEEIGKNCFTPKLTSKVSNFNNFSTISTLPVSAATNIADYFLLTKIKNPTKSLPAI